MNDPAPPDTFVVRNHVEGFSVLCLDHAAPWWWPRGRDTPRWWPLMRLLPERRRPMPPQPVSLAWVRCENGDLGAAALKVIMEQSRHVHRHPTHRTEIRESGTVSFDTGRPR